jgi:hypothetical protein
VKPAIPKTVRITSYEVPVLVRRGLTDHGVCYASQQAIVICADDPKWIQAQTLLHECLHLVDAVYNLNLTEGKVAKLEVALTALIRDNPALLLALVAGPHMDRRHK